MRAVATVLIVWSPVRLRRRARPMADLLRRIDALQKAIEQQSREIEELRRLLAQLPPPAGRRRPRRPPRRRLTVTDGASWCATAQRTAEVPPDQIAASEFPGSFPIPNSDAALKIGGLVRVNWVSTSDALLVDDRFVTSAIPVAGTAEAVTRRARYRHRPAQPVQLRPPDADRRRLHARVHRGRFRRERATRCACGMRTASGDGSSSAKPGRRSRILKPSPTASTSKD